MLEEISIKTPEIRLMMEQFNLDEQEMVFYLTVLRTPKITISMIATINRLDRTKAYRTSTKLESLGLIEQRSANPVTLVGIKPEEAFENLIINNENKLKTMQNSKDVILKMLNKIYEKNDILDQNVFSIIQGIDFSYSRVISLIKKAKTKIDIVIPFKELRKQYFSMLPEELARKKIPIRLITNALTQEEKKFVKQIKNCEIGFLETKYDISRMIVTENWCMNEIFKDTMRYFSRKDFSESTNIMTNSHIMVLQLQKYFNILWRKCEHGN